MEYHATIRKNSRAYYTGPWRKARICARFVMHPEFTQRDRYARLAAKLTNDPSVSNRLIGQAIAYFEGKNHQRNIAT